MTVDEMDPDAVIARRPTVALVDELAHTNAPGSARPKRWEDVEAIRDAGIHVVSTMNVQHLDSLADAVATITGAPVHERLPDEVLLGADEIELVDMSPHALRQRMRHGNVYPPDRTRVALDRFFTEANLTALRELALRVTARRVEGQLEDVNHASLGLVAERVLVLVDGSPSSARAVRRAASMAGAIHGALIALVPAQAVIDALPFDRSRDLREALDDAVELGAATLRFDVDDPVELVARAVESTGAHQLFLPWAPAGRFGGLARRPVAERIAERLPDLDLHLVAPKA
jgi:two-component system sensor histidine kinase KdpD